MSNVTYGNARYVKYPFGIKLRNFENVLIFRSSRPDVFYEMDVLIRKQGSSYIRVACLKLQASACNFFEKETLAEVFPCEFWEIFKNTFFTQTSWRLPLDIILSDHSLTLHSIYIIQCMFIINWENSLFMIPSQNKNSFL